jgi:uncharacterized protein (TIGR02996 family)
VREFRGVYHSVMQYDDDIALQRAILATPGDTTLKLVYADWLQDRADPRAEYIRFQHKITLMRDARQVSQEHEKLVEIGRGLDPTWVGFMTTLAQPFIPITFQEGKPGHPFTQTVGLRGCVVVFSSQYYRPPEWSEGLLTDLSVLASVDWELCGCAYGASTPNMHTFLCDLQTKRDPLRASDVLKAIKAADFQSEHIRELSRTSIPYPGYHPYTVNDEIHTDFAGQYMFEHDTEGDEDAGTHGALKQYVTGGRLWYVLLHTGGRPCSMVTLLAVGRSPHGNRLVGAITSQVCHNLCD